MNHPSYAPRRRPLLLTVNDGGQTAIVMIGPIRGPEHLALIHDLRFYHVPVSAIAASRADVGFVAFYEPAARFRADAGVIREYAEVVGVSRVRRRDLPGLTWPGRRSDETPYYRFDLGPILSLPNRSPIRNACASSFAFPIWSAFGGPRTSASWAGEIRAHPGLQAANRRRDRAVPGSRLGRNRNHEH